MDERKGLAISLILSSLYEAEKNYFDLDSDQWKFLSC